MDKPISDYFDTRVIQIPIFLAWLFTPLNEVSNNVRLNQRKANHEVVEKISESTKAVDAPFSVVLSEAHQDTTLGSSLGDDKNDDKHYNIIQLTQDFCQKLVSFYHYEEDSSEAEDERKPSTIPFSRKDCVEIIYNVLRLHRNPTYCSLRDPTLIRLKEVFHEFTSYRFHAVDGNHRFRAIDHLATKDVSVSSLNEMFWEPASVIVITQKDQVKLVPFSDNTVRFLRYKSMCINAQYVRISGTSALSLLEIALHLVETCKEEGTLTSLLDSGFFDYRSKGT